MISQALLPTTAFTKHQRPAMPAPSAASAIYQKLFHKCLTSRVPVDRFESYTRQLFSRSPISPLSIAAEIASPALSLIPDPLQLQYIQRLVETNFLSLGEVLCAVARSSTNLFSPAASSLYITEDELQEARKRREDVEAGILLTLAGTVRFQKPKNPESIWTAIAAIGKWMEISMEHPRSTVSKEGTAEVIIALGQNEGVMKVWTGLIGAPPSRDLRAPFAMSLAHFTQVLHNESPLISSRMEGLFHYQHSPGQQQRGKIDVLSLATAIRSEEGADIIGLSDSSPQVWARGSGIVWVDSLLVGLPLTDEDAILSYLTSRYRSDTPAMVSEFVLAAFDALATTISPHHPTTPTTPHQTFLVRSFILNKIPLILTRIFVPQNILNAVLSQVLLRIDPSILANNPGNPFGGNGDMHSLPVDIRQEFLFALALHGLIEEAAIQGILGELPMMTLPASGRYNNEDLVSQCHHDPDRVERLLEEIESLEGNAGAIALAVVEVIRGMCEKKETLSLRSICGFLTRKPSTIDVIMMFVKPAFFLEPLCVLLDTWRYEEDLGEYQPVYEDFGYILLLVLTTIHRYDLPVTPSTLGESSDHVDSFIPQLLTKGLTAQRIENIDSVDTHAQLGGWIKEIFEGEGISDSLMATCRPQDFYMLVPTFFQQSVIAVHRGLLDIEALEGGFTYLLEPFLMPSLVSALTWLGNVVWENSSAAGLDDNLMVPLQIMQLLVVPSSQMSVEKSMVHQTVLSITARHLEQVVREVVRSMDHALPQAPQITAVVDAILQAINPHLGFRRAGTASHHELESWLSSTGTHHQHGTVGGLVPTFKATVRTLIGWSAVHYGEDPSKTAENSGAPWYTHRLTQSVAHAFGSRKVVSTLIDIIYSLHQQQAVSSANGSKSAPADSSSFIIVDLAIDFAAALITSPTSVSACTPTSSCGEGITPPLPPGISSPPYPQPPYSSQQAAAAAAATAPFSLLDALRIEASKVLASISSTATPTDSPTASSRSTTRGVKRPAASTSKAKTASVAAPSTPHKVKLDPRSEILARLANKVENLLIPYQSQAILPAGTVRAIVPTSAAAAPVNNTASTASVHPEAGGSGSINGNADDAMLMGMGFGGMGGGFGGGFGGMDLDFGGVDGELDLLSEFDASGMDLR